MGRTAISNKKNIDSELISLIKRAKGNRKQKEFAVDADISQVYLSRLLNGNTVIPLPNTLRKIAGAAVNDVTFADLLEAAGYEVAKYDDVSTISVESAEDTGDSFWKSKMKNMIIKKLESLHVGVISEGHYLYDLTWSCDSTRVIDVRTWNFLLYRPKKRRNSKGEENYNYQLDLVKIYGALASYVDTRSEQITIVTDNPEFYDYILTHQPYFPFGITTILTDPDIKDIVKEEALTKFKDSIKDVFDFWENEALYNEEPGLRDALDSISGNILPSYNYLKKDEGEKIKIPGLYQTTLFDLLDDDEVQDLLQL